jgi:hypothetical protein
VGFRVARDTIPSNFHENQISQVGSVFLPIIYIKGQIPSFVFINSTDETLINSKRKKQTFCFTLKSVKRSQKNFAVIETMALH